MRTDTRLERNDISDDRSHRAGERLRAALLFGILVACYLYFFPRWADPNQNSRLDMVFAVVEDGTFQIDKYVENTVDYAKVGGHYYSDKAPGSAFLGIPVYAALKRVLNAPVIDGVMGWLSHSAAFQATLNPEGTGVLGHKVRFAVAQVAVTAIASALPTALIGALMYRLLAAFTPHAGARAFVALGYGLLTPVFPYAGAFYGHQLSAACLFTVFFMLFTRNRPYSPALLAGAGFLLAYSVITEYPSALVAAFLFVYASYRLGDRRRVGWILLPGLLVGAAWMAYNTHVFGSPFELGYKYSELWVDRHQTGFMSITYPHWEALWGITFSPFRGLFFFSPVLLLTVPGFILWWRSREHRAELWVALASVVAMILFNASSVMWWGGFAVGPRYLLPALPFLAIPAIFVLVAWKDRLWMKLVGLALVAWSLVALWGLALAGQSFPPDSLRNPLLEYALPHWREGNIARNLGTLLHLRGTASLVPLGLFLGGMLTIVWRATRRYGQASSRPVRQP
jgi:hypothetical protein